MEATGFASVGDNKWVILLKPSSYWKARVYPSQEDTTYTLDVMYGRGTSPVDEEKPSYSYEFKNRELAIEHLVQMVQEKMRLGYKEITDKENIPRSEFAQTEFSSQKADSKEPTSQAGSSVFGDAAPQEVLQTEPLGKRLPEQANPMSISEILDTNIPRRNPAAVVGPSPNKLTGSRPDEAIPVSSGKKSYRSAEVVRDTEPAMVLAASSVSFGAPRQGGEEVSDHPEPHLTASKVFSRRVSGEKLYGPGAKAKHFTQVVLLQARGEYFYTEYRVEQDPTLEKKNLYRMESHNAALEAIAENEKILAKDGYCEEEGEGYTLITPGAIQIMIQKGPTQYTKFTDLTADELALVDKEESGLPENIELVEAPSQPVVINPPFEALEIGENLNFDIMSQADLEEIFPHPRESLEICESRRQEKDSYLKGELKVAGKQQPLGPPSEGMQPLMLLQPYKETIEISNWLVSEKLDGLRCLWTGKSLISRAGRYLNAPQWFTRSFPNSTLDGEIYIGRGKYSELGGLLSGNEGTWLAATFMVFDAPGINVHFAHRYHQISEVIKNLDSNFIKVVPHTIIKSKEAAQAELRRIEAEGGEGLVLRNPKAFYEAKRSWAALKFKTIKDEEVTYSKMGENHAIVVDFKGQEVTVKKGVERLLPLKINDRLLIKYTKLTEAGLPLNAAVVRKVLRN